MKSPGLEPTHNPGVSSELAFQLAPVKKQSSQLYFRHLSINSSCSIRQKESSPFCNSAPSQSSIFSWVHFCNHPGASASYFPQTSFKYNFAKLIKWKCIYEILIYWQIRFTKRGFHVIVLLYLIRLTKCFSQIYFYEYKTHFDIKYRKNVVFNFHVVLINSFA